MTASLQTLAVFITNTIILKKIGENIGRYSACIFMHGIVKGAYSVHCDPGPIKVPRVRPNTQGQKNRAAEL